MTPSSACFDPPDARACTRTHKYCSAKTSRKTDEDIFSPKMSRAGLRGGSRPNTFRRNIARVPPHRDSIQEESGDILMLLGKRSRAQMRVRGARAAGTAPNQRGSALRLEPVTPPTKNTGDARHKMAGPTGSSPIFWHVLDEVGGSLFP